MFGRSRVASYFLTLLVVAAGILALLPRSSEAGFGSAPQPGLSASSQGAIRAQALVPVSTGLRQWLKASDITGLVDGQAVATWTDTKPTGTPFNATQAEPAKQPIFKTNVLNGKPVVRFAGTSQYMTGSLGALSAPFTIFAVAKFANLNQPSGDHDYVLNVGSVTANANVSISRAAAGTSGDKYFVNSGGVANFGPALSGQSWLLLTAQHRTASTFNSLWVNGTSYATADYSAALNTNGTEMIGAYSPATGYGNFFNGDLAELIIYDRALSDSERQQVESYLALEYALTVAGVPTSTPTTQPTATRTATAVPTATATNTSVPPTATAVPPTATSVPPTATSTAVPSTATSVPATATTVANIQTSISVAPATGALGGTTTLSATLTNSANGAPIEGKGIWFYFGGDVTSAMTDASGVATLSGVSLAGLSAGFYSNYVQASFAGTTGFDPVTGYANLTVSQAVPILQLAPASGTYSGATNLVATLSSGAAGIAGATINFSVDGSFVGSADTDASGVATFQLASISQNAGVHPMSASFAGNANYAAANTDSSMTVLQATTNLSVPPAQGAYGGNIHLEADITPAGPPTFGVTIGFSLNGIDVGYGTADQYGHAVWDGNLPAINAGTYSNGVVASFAGNTNFAGSNAANTLTVTKRDTVVTVGPSEGSVGGTATFSATLTRAGTPPVGIPERTISFYLNGVLGTFLASATTNANGVATVAGFSLAGYNSGTYTLTARFVGDDNYSGFVASSTLTVTEGGGPVTPTINWSNPADIIYGTPLDYTQLNATASFSAVSGTIGVPGNFVYTPVSGTVLHAGNGQALSVTFNPADPASYSSANATVHINVLRAPVTVTVENKTKNAGQPNPSFSAIIEGLVNGDTPSDLGNLDFFTDATTSSPPGSYPITAGGFSSPDYLVTYVPGTLTVTTAPPPPTGQDIDLHTGWNWFSFAVAPQPHPHGGNPIQTAYFHDYWGSVTLNGQRVAAGTKVEAFSPRGDLVGSYTVGASGYFGFMRVYGQDPQEGTPVVTPGMRAGETIVFKVDGFQAQIPSTQSPAPDVWQPGAYEPTRVDLIADFGLPVAAVLDPSIGGQYDFVIGEEGTFAVAPPYPGANQLINLVPGRGYFIRMRAAATLHLDGQRLPDNYALHLGAGWRWIGFIPGAQLMLPGALGSIGERYDYILGETGTFAPFGPPFLNNLDRMMPGKGYVIRMRQPGVLIYSAPPPPPPPGPPAP